MPGFPFTLVLCQSEHFYVGPFLLGQTCYPSSFLVGRSLGRSLGQPKPISLFPLFKHFLSLFLPHLTFSSSSLSLLLPSFSPSLSPNPSFGSPPQNATISFVPPRKSSSTVVPEFPTSFQRGESRFSFSHSFLGGLGFIHVFYHHYWLE